MKTFLASVTFFLFALTAFSTKSPTHPQPHPRQGDEEGIQYFILSSTGEDLNISVPEDGVTRFYDSPLIIYEVSPAALDTSTSPPTYTYSFTVNPSCDFIFADCTFWPIRGNGLDVGPARLVSVTCYTYDKGDYGPGGGGPRPIEGCTPEPPPATSTFYGTGTGTATVGPTATGTPGVGVVKRGDGGWRRSSHWQKPVLKGRKV